MSIISTQLVSALNNYNSIVPIVTKDLVENGGRTIMAYSNAGEKTKKYEATEKFIEANAASFLWYGVIPLTKKIYDKTVFKLASINPEVSLKFLDKKKQNQTIKNILEKVDSGDLPKNFTSKSGNKIFDTAKILKNISKNAKTTKALHIGRLILSTAIPTYLSAVVLPKSIIAFTQWKINKDKKIKTFKKDNTSFGSFEKFISKPLNKISFKGAGEYLVSKATQAQTSLLGDMVAVDLAISGSRVYYANKREKEALKNKKTKAPYAAALEKLIREGGFLYLIYFGGQHIKKAIDKVTKNKFDSIMLEDKNFVSELKSDKFKTNPLKGLSEKEQLDFIDKNLNDKNQVFLKYAKKMKWIQTVKDKTGKVFRNPLVYLDTKNLEKQFQVMSEAADEFVKSGSGNLEKFVNKKIKTKRIGTYANLAASSFAVCYVLPKIMYGFRKWYTGSSEEPGISTVMKNS